MTTAPATFGDLFSAAINNFKVGFTFFKPRVIPALLITVVPTIATALVMLLTIGSATLAGAGILGAFQGGNDASEVAEGAALATISMGAILATLILIPLGAFFAFCLLRFVARANQDQTRTFSAGELFAPDSSFIGFLGLQCLVWLSGAGFLLVGLIVAMVTFFLLGLPVYFVYFFFMALWTCSAFTFFEPSAPKAFTALSRGFTLIRKDWKRWLAMSIVMIGAIVAFVVVSEAFNFTINKIPVVGPITGQVLNGLIYIYLAFVMHGCYRDSSAAVPH